MRRSAAGRTRSASPSGSTSRSTTSSEQEGRAYDLIHTLNALRKERGLELTDRIVVTLPTADADLADRHGDWIKAETLAVELRVDSGALDIEKVEA